MRHLQKMDYLSCDGADFRPALQPSALVGYQPVFSADGRVCEYALPELPPAEATRHLIDDSAAHRLHDAVYLFRQGYLGIPLSFRYARDAPHVEWSARGVCAELNLSLDRSLLRLGMPTAEDHEVDPSYPAPLFTLNIPMVWDLLPNADLHKNRRDFNVGLRVRLGPTLVEGRPHPHGVLRVVGLHLKIPERLSEQPMLNRKFLSLLQSAQALKLPVLATDINHAIDFHWLRSLPNLMFQGDLLSPRIGADSLDLLLTMGGDRWRDFKVGGQTR
ncbi:hypothetical protein IB257_17930 [Achromobacter sp. ACM03]|uniref:hypothetical protein n=1 Tax=Achromobacter sp. ACM03 TaxID=2769300 RepID=UPI001781CB92|nr:hypothetical protein [Achromobacter sp. ACM03]MBD9431821.1 hypothetical protein [Achromobacter sp. ACM03]